MGINGMQRIQAAHQIALCINIGAYLNNNASFAHSKNLLKY